MFGVFVWFVLVLWCDAIVLMIKGRTEGKGWSTANLLTPLRPQVNLLLAVSRRLFCFGSLMISDVVCRYLSLFLLCINKEIDKKNEKRNI